MHHSIVPLVLAVAANLVAACSSTSQAKEAAQMGTVDNNGVKVYFEIHGSGEPLVLLHGGFGAIEMFGANLAELAKHHRVIGIDLQGHGRTALGDRPMSLEAMGDDVVAVLDHLKIKQADVMGYSLGGETAMALVTKHPDRVKRLVVVSAPIKRDGWHAEMTAGMDQIGPEAAEQMKNMPMYAMYAKLAPTPADWPRLCGELGKLLRKPFDFSATKFPTTMIVVGDADGVKLTSAIEFFGLLGGGKTDAGWDGKGRPASQLAVLAGQTHYGIFMAPALVATVEPFLAAK
jgi:pimeloyl-ACP methyl ester carboxylesterase